MIATKLIFMFRRSLPMAMTQTERLQVLSLIFKDIDVRINERAAHRDLVAACTESGRVGLIIDSTDCDHCRSIYSRVLRVGEVEEYIDALYANAEGPTHVQIVKQSSLRSFVPSSRDLAMEAFEDGHPSTIYR